MEDVNYLKMLILVHTEIKYLSFLVRKLEVYKNIFHERLL